MEKIRIDFFDILGYLIPGSALLMVFWIGADSKVSSIGQIYHSINEIDKNALLVAVFIAYIAGFLLHALGDKMYDLFRYKKIVKYTPSEVQHQWAVIREYGERHISILERWYALRALSQNLSAVSLIAGIVCIFKFGQYRSFEWLFLLLMMFSLCYVF